MIPRILAAVVAIPLLMLVILVLPVWVLGLVCGIVAAIAAWELLHCAERSRNPRFGAYTAVTACLIPFLSVFYDTGRVHLIVLFVLMAAMFTELMLSFRREEPLGLDTVTLALMAGGLFPMLLSSFVLLGLRENGRVYALLPLVVSFASDSGGYFGGSMFGRHKLTPRLSPHKTLEGSIGAFILAIGLTLVYGLILRGTGLTVNLPVLGAYAFLGSLASQAGDLAFSAVKRLSGVKDYGKLIPGHGGILDRIDSILWCAPLLYFLTLWVPAIT